MSANLVPSVPGRRKVRRAAGVVQGLLVAAGLVLLSFPLDARENRGGSTASARSSSGGSSSSSAGSRSSSGGGSRSSTTTSRSSSGGGRTTTAAPRSSSGGGKSATTSSGPRRNYGESGSSPSGSRYVPGPRTVSATGTRGGQGGYPGGGGGHPRGGHHGGGRGWYCPPTYYYGGSSWLWGGPWDWWWGWGPYWGVGPYWGWGGVYVINEVSPYADQYARVDTDVSPEAAEVYLDGTLIGQADDFDGFPDYLYLETGRYRLELRHPFYETVARELDVRAGQAIQVNDEMKLLPGKKKLQVVDPEDRGTPLGRVFGKPDAQRSAAAGDRTGRYDVQGGPDSGIDGEPVEVDLSDPDEDVRAPRPPAPPPAGTEAWRATEPKAGDVAPAAQGRLRFEIEPDDAAVYVDDRYVGTAEELGGLSRGIRVPPGSHTVTVVRPGYGTKTVEVTSKAGAAVDVVIELEK